MLSGLSGLMASLRGDRTDSYVTLGLDIGTTSCKAVIVQSTLSATHSSSSSSSSSGPSASSPPSPPFVHSVLSFHAQVHDADVRSARHPLHSEQDTTRLLSAAVACIRALPVDHRRRVEWVGVSCQMHGVVLWSEAGVGPFFSALVNASPSAPPSASSPLPHPPPHSHLIDWRDQRCSSSFLRHLNSTVSPPPSSRPLQSGQWMSSGYGCATLAHIAHTSPATLTSYSRSSTIGDYVCWLLTNVRDEEKSPSTSAPAYIHPTNAAAWGCFDLDQQRWEVDRCARWGVPTRLLPTVLTSLPLFPVSPLWVQWLELSPRVQVSVAVGDAQASVWAVHPTPSQLVLYVGTSAQLSLVDAEEEGEEEEEEEGEEDEGEEGERGRAEVSTSATVNSRAEGEEAVGERRRPMVDFALPTPPLSSSSSSSTSATTAVLPLPSCEYRPYLVHSLSSSPSSSSPPSRLLVCASVNGGNAFEWLARCVQLLLAEASELSTTPSAPPPSLSRCYALLMQRGLHHFAQAPELSFEPTFLPDRWAPSSPPSLTLLSSNPSALSLGSLASSLCRGLMRHLKASLERSCGQRERRRLRRVKEVVGVGAGLRRNGLLRLWAEKEWGRPLTLAQPLTCEWKKAETEKERERRGGRGREDGEEEEEEVGVYHRDAALGAAILGLGPLMGSRRKERLASQAM